MTDDRHTELGGCRQEVGDFLECVFFPPQWCNNSSLVTHDDVLHSFTGLVRMCVYMYCVCESTAGGETYWRLRLYSR